MSAALAVLVILAIPRLVSAGPVLLSSANYGIDPGAVDKSSTSTTSASWQLADGSAQASADFGTLRGFATAVSTDTADFRARASWADDFTIGGGPVGSLATFLVSVELDGFLDVPDASSGANPGLIGKQWARAHTWLFGLPGSGDPCTELQQRNGPETTCSYSAGEWLMGTYTGTVSRTFTDTVFNGLSRSFAVQLIVGQTYNVRQELYAQAYVQGMLAASATSNYWSTLHFYLDPLTAGASYTTASGTDYRSVAAVPVPEPGAFALFGTGITGLLGLKRRGAAGWLSRMRSCTVRSVKALRTHGGRAC